MPSNTTEQALEAAIEIVDIAKLAGAEKFMIATQPGSNL